MIWIAAIVAVYVIGLFALPVTIWRDKLYAQGVNFPGLILMKRGLPVPGAVWAQEFYEARRAWRWLPIHLVLMAAGRIAPKWAAWERAQEITGHEITVQAEAQLAGADAATVRARQAAILATSYKALRGHSAAHIEAAMTKQTSRARKFANRHFSRIQKMNRA